VIPKIGKEAKEIQDEVHGYLTNIAANGLASKTTRIAAILSPLM
jgi:uncharacterized membrane protein